MEIVSILWFVVFLALLILVTKIIINSIRVIFFLLVVALVVVFWFGISYTDVVASLLDVLLWVL